MTAPVSGTDRVRLVSVAATDVDRLIRGDTGGLAGGGLPLAPGWPHDDTAHGLGFARSGGLTWLICDEHGRVAGECGTKAAPDSTGSVEIGYGLAVPSRGKGLGATAIEALLDQLANTPGVRRVEAEVDVDNIASVRLLARAGFAEVDRGVDQVRFALDLQRK
jgi:RimJ/RimL family protein N-acetyltransferase